MHSSWRQLRYLKTLTQIWTTRHEWDILQLEHKTETNFLTTYKHTLSVAILFLVTYPPTYVVWGICTWLILFIRLASVKNLWPFQLTFTFFFSLLLSQNRIQLYSLHACATGFLMSISLRTSPSSWHWCCRYALWAQVREAGRRVSAQLIPREWEISHRHNAVTLSLE